MKTAPCVVWLLLPALSYFASAAPPTSRFTNETERRGFLQALQERDASYDPKEKMLQRPFSSPGYHTALKGGMVHSTRESLGYAVALLDSGEPERLARAEDVLRRVIALQDQDPKSRMYGIWSWFLEEPLDKMSPPDWNWADFCGTQLLAVARDHSERLPEDLRDKVRQSILHAARSIVRRNVGPGYTNIALMGTYVTLVAGETFNDADLTSYGKTRLRNFLDYTKKQGSFSEYNSPTYTIVAIEVITRMLQDVRDAESQKMLAELNRIAWSHVARHFHPPTRQWAGPHSRCYSTLLGERTLAFLQRATGGKAHFLPDDQAAESLDVCRIRPICPADLISYFVSLPEPRQEREVFVRGGNSRPDTVGTTWLHPQFTLGSVNCGDLWNQRRPLLAYWKQGDKAGALRLRCLHDGYDYSSAAFFSVQDKGDLLGGVAFATDGGDTHPSLDRVKNATIRAKDLRLRFQVEGASHSVSLLTPPAFNRPLRWSLGDVVCDLYAVQPVFGDFSPKIEMRKDGETVSLDVVLYEGESRDISFGQMNAAAVVFALAMGPKADRGEKADSAFATLESSQAGGRISATWPRAGQSALALGIPLKPASFGRLRASFSAGLPQRESK